MTHSWGLASSAWQFDALMAHVFDEHAFRVYHSYTGPAGKWANCSLPKTIGLGWQTDHCMVMAHLISPRAAAAETVAFDKEAKSGAVARERGGANDIVKLPVTSAVDNARMPHHIQRAIAAAYGASLDVAPAMGPPHNSSLSFVDTPPLWFATNPCESDDVLLLRMSQSGYCNRFFLAARLRAASGSAAVRSFCRCCLRR